MRGPLKQSSAAAGSADWRPGLSSQCQPADRRVRTLAASPRACPPLPGHSDGTEDARERGWQTAEGMAPEHSEFHLQGPGILAQGRPSAPGFPVGSLLLAALLALPLMLGTPACRMVPPYPPQEPAGAVCASSPCREGPCQEGSVASRAWASHVSPQGFSHLIQKMGYQHLAYLSVLKDECSQGIFSRGKREGRHV